MSIISQGDEEAIKQVEKLEALRQSALDSGRLGQAQMYTEQIDALLEELRNHGVILVPSQPSSAQPSSAQTSERTTPAADYTIPDPTPPQSRPAPGNPQPGKRIQFRMKQK